ncbi:MAG TPA: DEAD/DEAH box helicase [Clostridia bacterium]|nr:DEAD/DEAH box helicase [Clostridia bacterium]
MSFKKFNINEKLITGLEKQNITKPTKIQEAVINIALENKDVIGQSLTGSGKTLAFLLPMMERIDSDSKDLQGLIIAPTHELVVQINQQILELSRNSGLGIKSATIIGNVNIKRQIDKLKKKPHIVVGTTGRLLKLIQMGKLKAHKISTLVIDEADRMLDENNIDGVKKVLKTTLKDRQVMVFSASINDEAIKEANDFMKDPEIIFIDDNEIAPSITHYSLFCERRDKPELLRKLIYSLKPKRALVFINKESIIEDVVKKLKYHKYNVLSLHGSASKQDRKKAMDDLKSGKAQVVIASDLAARGLDIKDVTHIFNLDLSEDEKSYLHRVGRTGREGKEGFVFSLVTEYEENYLRRLERKYTIEVHPLVLEHGQLCLEQFEE